MGLTDTDTLSKYYLPINEWFPLDLLWKHTTLMSLSKSVPHNDRTGKVIGFQVGLSVQLATSVLYTNWYCPSSPTLYNSKNG